MYHTTHNPYHAAFAGPFETTPGEAGIPVLTAQGIVEFANNMKLGQYQFVTPPNIPQVSGSSGTDLVGLVGPLLAGAGGGIIGLVEPGNPLGQGAALPFLAQLSAAGHALVVGRNPDNYGPVVLVFQMPTDPAQLQPVLDNLRFAVSGLASEAAIIPPGGLAAHAGPGPGGGPGGAGPSPAANGEGDNTYLYVAGSVALLGLAVYFWGRGKGGSRGRK